MGTGDTTPLAAAQAANAAAAANRGATPGHGHSLSHSHISGVTAQALNEDGDIQILDPDQARDSPGPSSIPAAGGSAAPTPTSVGLVLPPRSSSMLSIPSGGQTTPAGHKHKFKPVQKLGLMSPREQLAAADKVPLVAASPRFSKIHTPSLGAGGANSPPIVETPTVTTPNTAGAGAGGGAASSIPNVSQTLSAAAAAAASNSAIAAQKAQEKRRGLGLARRSRGNSDAKLSVMDGTASGKNTGDSASITAAVNAANALYGGSGGGAGGGGATTVVAAAPKLPTTTAFHDIDPLSFAKTNAQRTGTGIVAPVPHRAGSPAVGAASPQPSPSPSPVPIISTKASPPNSGGPTAPAPVVPSVGAIKPTRPSIPKPGAVSIPLPAGANVTGSGPNTPVLSGTKAAPTSGNIFSDPIFQLASSAAAGAAGGNGGASAGGGVGLASRNKKLLGGAIRKNRKLLQLVCPSGLRLAVGADCFCVVVWVVFCVTDRRSRSNPSNLYEDAIAATAASVSAGGSDKGAGAGGSSASAASSPSARPTPAPPLVTGSAAPTGSVTAR